MTDASDNKLHFSLIVSDPKSTLLSGPWLSLAKPMQTDADTVSACFIPHSSVKFAPNPTSLQVEPTYKAGPAHRRPICHRWNYQLSQSCSYPYCRFEHVCYICADNPAAKDIHHKAIFCPYSTTNIHQPVTTQRPKPLFP